MLENELQIALQVAEKASRSILKFYETDIIAEEKLGADNEFEPVTEADREASRIIVAGLAEAFPDDAILSEEEADDTEKRLSNRRVWIVDPIDGTAGFVKKDGDFSVQIGLSIDGEAAVGVVMQPYLGITTYATKDGGAFIIKKGSAPEHMSVTDRTSFTQMTMAMTRNHPTHRIQRVIEHFGFANILRRGSVGLKTGLIANGECDIYIHPSPRTKLWDTCAPQIILEEAGGRLTDIFGGEIRYDTERLPNLNGILASNGAAHEAAVDHLRPLLTEFGRVRVI